MSQRETDRDRLVALIKALAHPYSGADLIAWETEALALMEKLLPTHDTWWSRFWWGRAEHR